jgi:chromosomal replication initiation ATPase DnaA
MHINYDAFAGVLGTNPKERLLEQNRTALVCDCRRLLAAHLRAHHYSLPLIGKTLKRHHTTVLHLIRTHDELISTDAHYRKLVETCGERILVHDSDVA